MSLISEHIQGLKTGWRDLRKFGLLVGGVFALLAVWSAWRGKPAFPYCLSAAVPLLVLGLVWPRALKWVYIPWMTLGFVVGLVVSTILLTIFFYLVVSPIGLLARAMGKDFLSRTLDPQAKSYWVQRVRRGPKQRQEYEQQF